ncbi:hypothetical protein CEXT_680981 [Caerostris extrusa]|uniref:Uncharacterized protein n=1 Tax=Caerostris extrusa TaxID=172846 RepID=A0AAV4XPN5_CAEEX|nr:hypothetical protein CEXT_680981 [Caerostris extrusa]
MELTFIYHQLTLHNLWHLFPQNTIKSPKTSNYIPILTNSIKSIQKSPNYANKSSTADYSIPLNHSFRVITVAISGNLNNKAEVSLFTAKLDDTHCLFERCLFRWLDYFLASSKLVKCGTVSFRL